MLVGKRTDTGDHGHLHRPEPRTGRLEGGPEGVSLVRLRGGGGWEKTARSGLKAAIVTWAHGEIGEAATMAKYREQLFRLRRAIGSVSTHWGIFDFRISNFD